MPALGRLRPGVRWTFEGNCCRKVSVRWVRNFQTGIEKGSGRYCSLLWSMKRAIAF